MQFIYHRGEKFLNKNNSAAQSVLEYALIIAIASAALIAMKIYLKRGFEGRLRQAADEMGQQYSPQSATSDVTTTLDMEQVTIQTLVPVKHADGSPVLDVNTGLEVYGTEVNTSFNETSTKASGSYEKVGPFEANLFD